MKLFRYICSTIVGCTAVVIAATSLAATGHPDGELNIDIVDSATGQPLPARMHLSSGRSPGGTSSKPRPSRAVKLNLPGSAEYGGHFYIDGKTTLPLKVGAYTFELEATPEYLNQTGQFQIERHADDAKRIEMRRFADLAKEGWYGGDIDFDRKEKDLPLILRAEGLEDIGVNKHALLLSDKLGGASAGSAAGAADGKEVDIVHIAPTPYAWNLPVWLANDEVDAMNLLHRHSLREGVVDNERDGRPRDKTMFPGPRGNGRWSEAIYYHVLNCGFHIPPVAGSGSGMNNNPVGANRVYVHCGSEFSAAEWWNGLKQGRVFVTNGPLLRPMVEGQPPGYVFQQVEGHPLTLEIGLNLATRTPVEYLQIIKNGDVAAEVRLAEFKDKKGKLPPVTFEASGWFLVRAVTNNVERYEVATTGPYYVEQSAQPRVSKSSAKFFLDWLDAADKYVRDDAKLSDADRDAQLAAQAKARTFFSELLEKANAN